MKTTISVSKDTVRKLEKLRIGRESLDLIIRRTIRQLKEMQKEGVVI